VFLITAVSKSFACDLGIKLIPFLAIMVLIGDNLLIILGEAIRPFFGVESFELAEKVSFVY
jgi:hypothetical protein